MTHYRTVIRKLKPSNLLPFSYCKSIRDNIRHIEDLGYKITIKFEVNKNKDSKDLVFGYYQTYLNDGYIGAIGYPKDDFKGFLRLDDQLETIYRTLFYLKNQN